MWREGSILEDKYKLLEPIGEGGMGSVWLAEKLATYERFAIKFIHQHALGDESYCARFAREVAVLRGLRHPNIVDVFDWSLPTPGRQPLLYVVMELLEGESLQDVLRRERRLPIAPMIRVMLQVLDGVSAVHAQGIIHRDLSPANIYLVGCVGPVPRVKILDFGLAKGVGSGQADTAVTQPGSVLGRAAYAAPEIFLDSELDVRADIFACGMILYRALTGRFPYRESKVDLMWAERYAERLKQDTYTPPTRFAPEIPGPVEKIIMRAIRKRPGDRFQLASDMQKELLWADNLLPPNLRGATLAVGHAAAPGAEQGRGSLSSSAPAVRRPGGGTLLGAPASAIPGSSPSPVPRTVPEPTPRTSQPAARRSGPIPGAAPDGTVRTEMFVLSDNTSTDLPTSAEIARESAGSQPSAAGTLAGDVASSAGSLSPRHRPAFRRPAVLAFAGVCLALVVTVVALVLRGGGSSSGAGDGAAKAPASSAQPARPSDGVPATAATKLPAAPTEAPTKPTTGPTVVPPPPPPFAPPPVTPPTDVPPTTTLAGTSPPTVPPPVVPPTPPALPPPPPPAAADAGAPVLAVRDAGSTAPARDAGTTAVARDDAGSTVAATRDTAPQVAAPRDAGPRRDSASGSTSPGSEFLTEYETPQPPPPRRDAGTTQPTGGTDDFLIDYESGRTP